MVIRFFDKTTLEIKGELSRFLSTTQTKYINAAGSFTFKTDYLPAGLALGDLVMATGAECDTYFGELTQIQGDIEEKDEYTFSGRELLGWLTERIPLFNSGGYAPIAYTSTARETIMKGIIDKLFINPDTAGRKISQFRLAASQGRGGSASYTCDPKASALDNCIAAGKTQGFGLSIVPDFAAAKYDIDIVVPRTPGVLISPRFDNLAHESFLKSNAVHKNIAAFAFTTDNIPEYGLTALSAGTGFDRKERWIEASGETAAECRSFANLQLGRFVPVESCSGEYMPSQTFKYGTDFVLGDYVTYSGRAGTAQMQLIGYTQTLDGSGKYTRLLIFGDSIAERVRKIQEIEGGR